MTQSHATEPASTRRSRAQFKMPSLPKQGSIIHSLLWGEGTAITVTLIMLIWRLVPWRPTDEYWSVVFTFLAGFIAVWYSNSQSASLVEATHQRNLADDSLPVRAMMISVVPVIFIILTAVIHVLATVFLVPEGNAQYWMLLKMEDWAFHGLILTACWGDLKHNATMLSRTQRYRQEFGTEYSGRDRQ